MTQIDFVKDDDAVAYKIAKEKEKHDKSKKRDKDSNESKETKRGWVRDSN